MGKENLIKEIESFRSKFKFLWNSYYKDRHNSGFGDNIYIDTLKKDIKDTFLKFTMAMYHYDKTHPLLPYLQSIPLDAIHPNKDLFDKENAERVIELMDQFLWYLNRLDR